VRLRGGTRELVHLRWGLVPYWAKDPKIAYSTINEGRDGGGKSAFRDAFSRRRCLAVTDGFYDWEARGPWQAPIPYRHARS
jgi:putative SOS response-associated peptidase YedK